MVKKIAPDFTEAIDDIYNLGMQAYSLKDYNTLEQTLDRMVKLEKNRRNGYLKLNAENW